MGQLDFLRDVFYSLKWATHISGPLGNILSGKCAETFKNGVKMLKMPAAGEENFGIFDSLKDAAREIVRSFAQSKSKNWQARHFA